MGREIAEQESGAAGPPRRRRRERGSITAEEIVNGAYALAAEISIEKLSMPLLARKLDIGVMSIYNYFKGKNDILDAMRDRALQQYEIAIPFTGAREWRVCLREHFLTMRDLFRDDPVLCDLLVMGTEVSPRINRTIGERIEVNVGVLVDAGFAADEALKTYLALALHSWGFAMLERRANLHADSGDFTEGIVDERRTPILASLTAAGHSLDIVQDALFEKGLDALLEQAQQTLAGTSK